MNIDEILAAEEGPRRTAALVEWIQSLWRAHRERIDAERLEQRVRQSGWLKAWRSLARFSEHWKEGEPPAEEVERWAIAGP